MSAMRYTRASPEQKSSGMRIRIPCNSCRLSLARQSAVWLTTPAVVLQRLLVRLDFWRGTLPTLHPCVPCRACNRTSFPWSHRWESNPRPLSYQDRILPLNYCDVEPPTGIEPVPLDYETRALPLHQGGKSILPYRPRVCQAVKPAKSFRVKQNPELSGSKSRFKGGWMELIAKTSKASASARE